MFSKIDQYFAQKTSSSSRLSRPLPKSLATSPFHLANRIFIVTWQRFFLFICISVLSTAGSAWLLNLIFDPLADLYLGWYFLKIFLFIIVTSMIIYFQYMTILELANNIYHGQPDNWLIAFKKTLINFPKLLHPSTLLIAIILSSLLAGADTALGGSNYANLGLKLIFHQIGAWFANTSLGSIIIICLVLFILYCALRLVFVFECLREKEVRNFAQAIKASWRLTRSRKNFWLVLSNMITRYALILFFTLIGIFIAEATLFTYGQLLTQISGTILTFIFGTLVIWLIFVTLIYLTFFILAFFPFSICQSAVLYQVVKKQYKPNKISIPSVRPLILKTLTFLSLVAFAISISLRLIDQNIIKNDLPVIAQLFKNQLYSNQLNIAIIDNKTNEIFQFQINGKDLVPLNQNNDLWQKINLPDDKQIYLWSANSGLSTSENNFNQLVLHFGDWQTSTLDLADVELFDKDLRQSFSSQLIDEIVRAIQIVSTGKTTIDGVFFK